MKNFFQKPKIAQLFAAEAPVLLSNPAPGAGATMGDFIRLLLDLFQFIMTPVLVLAYIYTGYLFVRAQGNDKEISNARKVLFTTLIGTAVVVGAKVIAGFISGTAALFQ